MVIYTVRAGDTLWLIGQRFQVTPETIMRFNGLESDTLVPGMALVIPTERYVVQRGDTLYELARRFNTTVEALARANNITDPSQINVGQVLAIPRPARVPITTMMYLVVTGVAARDRATVQDHARYSTYMPMFEYHTNWDGYLSPLDDAAARAAAWEQGVVPVATITNLTAAGFNPDIAHNIVTNRTAGDRLIYNIRNLIEEKNYGGVNIDFEGVRREDRDAFVRWLYRLKGDLPPGRDHLSIAVPAKTREADHPGYDYAAIGDAVDAMFVMAYDFHWFGGPPGPIAPLPSVRATLDFATRRVDPSKIILGIPLYGYDWPITAATAEQAWREGHGERSADARSVPALQALQQAVRRLSAINYDAEWESPWYAYADENGQTHVVWFEDARSADAKLRLARRYGLGGVGVWRLGFDFPQFYALMDRYFDVRKV